MSLPLHFLSEGDIVTFLTVKVEGEIYLSVGGSRPYGGWRRTASQLLRRLERLVLVHTSYCLAAYSQTRLEKVS